MEQFSLDLIFHDNFWSKVLISKTHSTKMGADSSAENTPNVQFVRPSTKAWYFIEKGSFDNFYYFYSCSLEHNEKEKPMYFCGKCKISTCDPMKFWKHRQSQHADLIYKTPLVTHEQKMTEHQCIYCNAKRKNLFVSTFLLLTVKIFNH